MPITRRAALAAPLAVLPITAAADPPADSLDRDRKFVLEAGLTEAEADCWKATAEAAGKFLALPKLHPMDDHEVAHAIHVIQNKLLSRPTYRKYLELAKAAAGK